MEKARFYKAIHCREVVEQLNHILGWDNRKYKKDECLGVISNAITDSDAFLNDKDGNLQEFLKEKSFEIVQGLIKLREDYEEQFREL